MKPVTLVLLTSTLFTGTALASGQPQDSTAPGYQERVGLGVGALIGGLLAGPPGAILGAAGGLWYGNHEDKETGRIASLQRRLQQEHTEVAYLQKRLDDIRRQFGQELQKVKLEDRTDALEQLSRGVSLAIFFRTNSDTVDGQSGNRLRQLAGFLKDYPEIQLHLEAHADQRGSSEYNKKLSARRAEAVRAALSGAGIDSGRIHTYAYGESVADHPVQDTEGMLFDRRVNIILNLDTRV